MLLEMALFDSVTQILFNLSLPSFDTLLHNSRVIFFHAWCKCPKYACLTYATGGAMEMFLI